MTGTADIRSFNTGNRVSGGAYFYFGFYYFTAVCPRAGEDLS